MFGLSYKDEPLRGKQVKVLCGPAAVNEKLCHCMDLYKIMRHWAKAWEGLDRMMIREPEDLHKMEKDSDG